MQTLMIGMWRKQIGSLVLSFNSSEILGARYIRYLKYSTFRNLRYTSSPAKWMCCYLIFFHTFYVRKLRPQLASRSLLQWLVLGSMYERPLRGRWILTGNLWKPAWRVMIHFVNIDKDLVLGRKTSQDSFARVARDHRSLLTKVLCILPAGWAGSSP